MVRVLANNTVLTRLFLKNNNNLIKFIDVTDAPGALIDAKRSRGGGRADAWPVSNPGGP